jgi:hypothetical protein
MEAEWHLEQAFSFVDIVAEGTLSSLGSDDLETATPVSKESTQSHHSTLNFDLAATPRLHPGHTPSLHSTGASVCFHTEAFDGSAIRTVSARPRLD